MDISYWKDTEASKRSSKRSCWWKDYMVILRPSNIASEAEPHRNQFRHAQANETFIRTSASLTLLPGKGICNFSPPVSNVYTTALHGAHAFLVILYTIVRTTTLAACCTRRKSQGKLCFCGDSRTERKYRLFKLKKLYKLSCNFIWGAI